MGCPKTLLYVTAGVNALLSDRPTFFFFFSIFGPPDHHTGIINVGCCHLIFDNPPTQRDKHIFQPRVLKCSPFFSPPGWTALILSYQPLCLALSLSKLLLLLGRNTSHLCCSSLHWSPVTFGADFRTLLLILLLI